MERWLFLDEESRKKIEKFSYELRDAFGEEFLSFRRVVPDIHSRQVVYRGYSLDDCFKQKKKMEHVRLIIGQKSSYHEPSIRWAFRQADVWADYILEHTPEHYVKTGELFVHNFNYTIEKYPHQKTR